MLTEDLLYSYVSVCNEKVYRATWALKGPNRAPNNTSLIQLAWNPLDSIRGVVKYKSIRPEWAPKKPHDMACKREAFFVVWGEKCRFSRLNFDYAQASFAQIINLNFNAL